MNPSRRLAAGAVAVGLAGLPLVASLSPAQAAPGPCRNAAVHQNPYVGTPGRGVSDDTPVRGEQLTASRGCSATAPGHRFEVGLQSTYQRVGTATADSAGNVFATFTVPSNLAIGEHSVVFTDLTNRSDVVRVPFTLVSGAPSGAGTSGSGTGATQNGVGGLPFTGFGPLVPLSVGGGALLAAGTVLIVAVRRRRDPLG